MKTALFILLCCAAAWDAAAQPALPPAPPPLPRAPVEYFRQLLALSPAARAPLLAPRPPESRRALEAKLAEYEKLPPAEREARLRATELRWQLTRLLRIPSADRSNALAVVPDVFRKLVEERLRQWDQFPAATRQKILTNEVALTLFTRLEGAAPKLPPPSLKIYPPPMRQKMEADLAQWKSLPEEQRLRTTGNFQKFFDLNEKQKTRTLKSLGETERAQMEKTLQTFEQLPKGRRELCLKGFQQFANLTPEERGQFLQNAEQWQTMSAEDREAWRLLVARVGTPARPPLPPGIRSTRPGTLVATNF